MNKVIEVIQSNELRAVAVTETISPITLITPITSITLITSNYFNYLNSTPMIYFIILLILIKGCQLGLKKCLYLLLEEERTNASNKDKELKIIHLPLLKTYN